MSQAAFPRVIWIVLDSVGIGAMPDWREYLDDMPGDTLGHCAEHTTAGAEKSLRAWFGQHQALFTA